MKSKFLVFCFSFVPGAGQMYQGYMKRGLSLMLMLGLAIVFTSFTAEMSIIFVPVIWAYAFFDTFNIARFTNEEKAEKPDKLMFNLESLTQNDLKAVYLKRHRWIGIGAIVFGVLMLYNTFIAPVLWQFYRMYEVSWLAQILNRLPNFAVAVALIFVGYKMIKNHAKKVEQDDIIEYKEGKPND